MFERFEDARRALGAQLGRLPPDALLPHLAGERRWVVDAARSLFATQMFESLAHLAEEGDAMLAGRENRVLRAALLKALDQLSATRRGESGPQAGRGPAPSVKPTAPPAVLSSSAARTDSSGADRLPPPPRDPGPGDGDALRTWARAHGVASLLERPVSHLGLEGADALLRQLFVYNPNARIIDVLLSRATYRSADLNHLKALVFAGLTAAGARFRRGDGYREAARAERLAAAGDAELTPLVDRLTELRGGLAQVPALDPADLPTERRVRFLITGRAPQLVWEAKAVHLDLRVKIPLELHAPLVPQCSFDGEHPCEHQLAAVDEIFRALARGLGDKDRAALLEHLRTPGWARALAELETEGSRAAPPEVEVTWWVRGTYEPEVSAVLRKRGKRDWLAPRVVRASEVLEAADEVEDADRRPAELLAMAQQIGGAYGFGATILASLVGHPRVRFGSTFEVAEPYAVEAHDARVSVSRVGTLLRASLVAGGLPLPKDRAQQAVVDEAQQRILVCKISRATRAAFERVSEAMSKVSVGDLPAFAARLALLDPSAGVDAPDLVPVLDTAAADAWTLRLAARDDGAVEAALYVAPLAGGGLHLAGEGPERVLAPQGRDRLLGARRDLEAERARVAAHWAAWGLESDEAPQRTLVQREAALGLVSAVRADTRGVTVEWTTKPIRVLPRLRSRSLRIGLESGPDWFGVEGEAVHDDHTLTLAMLLDAARRKSDFVRVADDTWVEMERTLSDRMRLLEPHVRAVRSRLEVGALSVPAIVDAVGEAHPPPRWVDIVQRARAAGALEPTVPTELRAELRPYQVEGFAWMARLAAWGAGAVLADDMGLGKTVQAIALLLHRASAGPALVVAPTSVTHNWRRELARFAPSLRVRLLRDDPAGVAELASLGAGDVLITSYGLLHIEAEALAKRRFATAVLDEAQVVKNPASRRSKAARALDAEWRVALTGTPIENHLGDLWAIVAAVSPGLLGSWEHFRARWAGASGSALDGLRRLVQPFILRRTKGEVLAELPPKTEVVVDVELSAAERTLYEDARNAATAELRGLGEVLATSAGRLHVFAALTRLRQLACDASLVVSGDAPASSKLARFAELAASLVEEGHSAIAFSQFVRLLDGAERALSAHRVAFSRLDGSTPSEARGEIVERFQSGGPSVLLVSLRAGGTGLNLTAADHVFHLDPWWNPAVEDQATDRAHRIGQTKPVTVFRLVARGTIESAILGLHSEKRALAAQVLEGTGAASGMSAEALLAMIAEGAGTGAAVEEAEDGPALAAAASPAPAPAGPPALAAAPALRAPLEALHAHAVAAIERDCAPATAKRYLLVLNRIVEVGRAAGLADPEAIAAAYQVEMDAGRRPTSDRQLLRPLTARLAAAAASLTA